LQEQRCIRLEGNRNCHNGDNGHVISLQSIAKPSLHTYSAKTSSTTTRSLVDAQFQADCNFSSSVSSNAAVSRFLGQPISAAQTNHRNLRGRNT